MPLTQLDPVAALIVVDLQKGIVGMQTAHPTADVISRSAELARAFRRRGLPVALINVDGPAPGRTNTVRPKFSFPPDWTDLVPELEQAPTDVLITKHRMGGFIGTTLDEELRKRGVTQVFLTGIATTAGVESTARSAYDLGYNVVLVADAMTDMNADAHRNSIERIFPRFGEVDTTDAVLKLVNEQTDGA